MSLPEDSRPLRPALPRLLILGLTLTALLTVGGIGLVVYGFAAGLSTPDGGAAFEQRLDLPAGAAAVRSYAIGDRLAIELRLVDGNLEVLLLDPNDGRLTGRIRTAGS